MDSTALLHAVATAARPLDVSVLALHVHHGLSARADDWLEHGDAFCKRLRRRGLDVVFAAHRIDTRPQPGDSVEAWARRARYRALRRLAVDGGADLVLLAHHRRDQAETFLLQAMRKGGVAALAAMPASARREGITWARPWLDQPREAIAAYARRHRLRSIEDDSNDDTRFARNRLRAQVWPAFLAAFPDAEASLASAARWAQEAAVAIDEIAAADVRALASERGFGIAAWRQLSPARQAASLRLWARGACGSPVPASLVERLLAEVDEHAARRWPAPGGELHSYRGALRWRPGIATPTTPTTMRLDAGKPGLYPVAAWRGALQVERVAHGGLALAVAGDLCVRARAAADRFQAGPSRPPRRLKLQYQAQHVAEADRCVPVFCHDDAVVYVPGLGLDARAIAPAGSPQVSLRWLPDPAG